MKRFATSLILLLCGICASAVERNPYPATFAHRGCWFKDDVPENSLHGVRMAKRFGYKGIECDVKYTADGVMVIIHDKTINRTLRNAADYSVITEKTYVKDLTFEELRNNYIMASDNPSMREKVPTLEELLLECKKEGVIPMLHSSITESYVLAQKIMGDGNWIAFSGSHKAMKSAREITGGLVLQSVRKNTEASKVLSMLETIGKPCGISTMSRSLLTSEFNSIFTKKGYEVQASIFKSPHEFTAFRNGVTIQLTDFCVMPDQGLTTIHDWNTKNARLKPGQVIEKSWDKMKYGATILKIRFKGTIEVLINGKYRYEISSNGKREDCIGIRFHSLYPSVKISAISASKIRSAEVSIQRPD